MSKVVSVDHDGTVPAGDTAEFLSTLRASLLAYCTGLTGTRETGEDIAQESMMKALPVIVGRVSHPNVKAYLFQIAKHTWLDQLKKRRTEAKLQLAMASHEYAERASGFEPGRLELEESVGLLLRHLTPRQRTVFLLRDVFEYTTTEVAHLLGITEIAVKGALHRARCRLSSTRDEDLRAVDDDIQKETLAAYAAAIQRFDIPAIVSLALLDAACPVHASVELRIVEHRHRHQPRVPLSRSTDIIMRAA